MIKQEDIEGLPLGAEFRRFREQRGWTIEAAAQVTKIRADQLQDLETDNYALFPSVACVRGFVRIYAKALGLDERRMVTRLDGRIREFDTERKPLAAIEKLPTPVVTKIAEPAARSMAGNLMAIVAVGVMGIFLWVAWAWWKAGGAQQTPAPAPPRAELAQGAAPVPAAGTPSAAGTQAPPRPPVATATPAAAQPAPPTGAPVAPLPGVPVAPPAAVPVAPVAVPVAPPAVLVAQPAVPMAEAMAEPTVENIPRAQPVQGIVRLQLVAEEEAFVKVVVNGNEEEPLFDGIVGARQTISCEGQRIYIKARPPSALTVSQNGGPPSRLGGDAGVQEFIFPR